MSTREMILQGSAGMQDDWTCETAWFSLTIHVTDQAVFTEFKDARSGRMLAEGPYRYYVVLEDEEGGRSRRVAKMMSAEAWVRTTKC